VRNAGTTVLWNGSQYASESEDRDRPPLVWDYYSQVSTSSPDVKIREGRLVGDRIREQTSPPPTVHGTVDSQAIPTGDHSLPNGLFPVGLQRDLSNQKGPWSLTQRELEVLQLLTEGRTNCEISERLFISPKTTKNHLAAIFQKLDVTNRTQALVRAVVMGLVSIE
jgi:DNA-binding CsgD family transcriptional regulator